MSKPTNKNGERLTTIQVSVTENKDLSRIATAAGFLSKIDFLRNVITEGKKKYGLGDD